MAPRRLSSVGPADTLLQAQFSEKKWVWVADKEEGYIAGWIARDNGNDVEVEFADGKKRTLSIDDTEKMNPPKFDKAEDMADLTYLNEASVVHNLGRRYASNLIYTYSGLFLVAINPYKKLPLYGEEMLKTYKGRKRCEMPPHIYAVADNAYSDMLQNRENQSILITGESGAGKTENTKKVIQYLTFSASASRGRLGTLEQQILQANPILESFGNAQTIRNNNSSRFGKFIKLEFNPMGRIVGANIERYLLEKSRVTHQSTKERSYHVFYQLLKGAPNEMKKQLLLDGSLIDYRFTKLSNKDIDSVDDTLEFKNLVDSMTVMQFNNNDQIDFFRVVAAILHLGNVGVIPDRDDQAILTENGQREAEKVCHLLGISVDDFSKSLLRPRIKAGRDWVVQSRDVSQVEYSIEALSRAMYERMFGSLVERINEAMGSSGPKSTYIGVLDIAGFEIFERNSFEQLCINYTNEKLQQFFNHHMFVIEQEEYKKEGIEWKFIDFGLDLQPTIDLIEKTTPVGILSCLDEECVMPKATDKTLMEKLSALWKGKSSKFDVPRFNSGFIIQHYAGVVEYDLDGWLDKNKDPLNENITRLLASSSDKFVASLFSDCAEYEDSPAKNRGITKRGAFRTVAQRHKEQLGLLMSQLYSTDPHFVRCIIPNGEKRPSKLDVNMILDQLRCNGVLEGIRICRAGFPNRLSFSDFRQRYELLAPKVIPKGFMDGQRGALLLIDALNLETNQYRLGTSKVFFKTGVLADLEERRDNKLTALVIRIQAMARGRIARKLYKKRIDQCRAIKIIQKNARIYVTLREWSWWKLYTKVKPLLNATRVDEELRRKDEQLKEWEELAKRERDDRARLENLQHALESEKKMMEELLFQEKNAAADQAEILARTQKRESDLNERLQQTTLLLEEKEQYVEKLLAMKSKLQSDYECVAERLAESQLLVEKAERDKNQRTEMLNGVEQELKQAAETASRLESERRNLEKQLHDAQAVLDSLSDQCNDMSRTQARAKASLADTESKLEQALQHSKAMEEKKLALEVDIARLRDSVADLTRSKADVESLLKRKEAELRDCLERLNEEKRVRENAEKSRRELQVSFNALKADYEAESLEREKSIRVRKKLEEELQHMALLIEERGSEETKQSELRRLREVELSDLKGQLGSTLQELENSRKHASLSIDKLNMELEAAKGELSLSSKAKGALETQKSEARAEIERLEDQNNRLEKAKRHLEQELSGARSAIADLDLQVEDLKVGKENAEAKVASLVARLDTSESLAARFEREKMSALRQIDSLKEELESATQKIVHQESLRKRDQTEISDLKARLEEDELARSELGRKLATQAQELATTKERLSKEMASKVAEHDEMKRRLEKELQEAGQKLLDIERNATNLEKSKSRLSTEVEDLHLELDKAYSSARNFERISKQLESQLTSTNVQLETERRQKETAESSVRKLQTALDSISVEFEEKQKEAAVVTKLKTDLELELKALIGEFGDHGKNLHELEKVKRKLEVHVLELEDSLAQERQLRANADEQRHSLEAQMADLRRKYDADLALKNTALEDTRRMLMKEVNSLGEQLEEVTQQKNDLFRQKKKMEESLELYSSRAESNAKGQSELEKAKRKADQALRELQNQLEDSERLRKNMEELALRHEQRANQLQASAELQEGQIEGLERSKRALEMRVEDLLQSIKSFEEGKATSVEEIRALEIQVKELENQLEEERLSRLQLESVKLYNASDIEQACSKTKEELEGKIEKLEESRRALLASQRIAQQELEDKANDVANMDKQRRLLQCEISDLKARLESEMMAKTDEVAARRRLANELKETQLKYDSEVAKTSELTDMINLYKTKTDAALSKVEAAEIIMMKAEKNEASMRTRIKDLEKSVEELTKEGKMAEAEIRALEEKLSEMQEQHDDDAAEISDLHTWKRRAQEDLAAVSERHRREAEEQEAQVEQLRKRYHKELKDLGKELDLERANTFKYKEIVNEVSGDVESLAVKLEAEQRQSIQWKKEKERFELKFEELSKSYSELQAAQDDATIQINSMQNRISDLRLSLEDAESQKIVLEKAKKLLEARLEDLAEQFSRAESAKTDLSKSMFALDQKALELHDTVEEYQDQVKVATDRARRAEQIQTDLQAELSQEKERLAEMERSKISLQKQVKELNARIVDYEAASIQTTNSSIRRMEIRFEELSSKLESEMHEKNESLKNARRLDRVVRELQFQLQERDKQKARYDDDIEKLEQKTKQLRLLIEELESSESNCQLAKRRVERECDDLKERILRSEKENEKLKFRLEKLAQ